jgi:hypothetical protein
MPDTVGEALRDAINEAGYEFRSYSGRGMYGAQFLGVDCDNPIKAAVEIILNLDIDPLGRLYEDCLGAIKRGLTDSMGRGSILYFPNVPYGVEDEINNHYERLENNRK